MSVKNGFGRSVRHLFAAAAIAATAAVPGALAQDGPIKIGIPTSIQVHVGKDVRDGAQLAIDEINAKGGVLGRKLEAVVADEGNDRNTAIAAIKKLSAEDKVDVMIGGWSSGFVLSQMPHIATAKTPYIMAGAAAPQITAGVKSDYEKFKYVFRMTPHAVDLARDVVDFAVNYVGKTLGRKKFAIVAESAAWTRALVPFLRANIKKAGYDVVLVEFFEIKTTDFSPIFSKVRRSGADFIIQVVSHATSDIFIKQWHGAKVAVPVGGLDAKAQEADFFKRVDGAAISQITIVPILRAPLTDKTIHFWDAFTKKYDRTPVYTASNAYDAVFVYAAAVERAKTTNKDAVVKALEATDYVGTTGRIMFDDRHELKHGPGFIQWLHVQWQAKGERVILYPSAKANGKMVLAPWMEKK